MRIASLAEVKAKLSAYLDEAGTSGPIVITRNGKAVAILLAPMDDDDLEGLLLSRSPRFRSLLSRSRASLRADKGVAHDTFWKAVDQRAGRIPRSREKVVRDRAAPQPLPPVGGRAPGEGSGSGKRRAPRG
jgi:prevent-host-death family protein